MPKAAPNPVDAYIAAQPDAARPVLEKVRAAIRKALPDAEEIISYSIPAYRLPGGTVLFFAGWKKHYSLYPVGAALVEAFGEKLGPYEVNSKGTIRFPLDGPVPVGLIQRIARYRAKEVAALAKAKLKKPAPKPRRV
jgi:uncharacterized protein YdhG (YjbR/CyaY superfamily)